MNEHSTTRDLLALAAAGLLEPSEQRRIEKHLHSCEACRADFDEWTRLAGALRDLPTPQAPPRLVIQTQRILAYAASLQGHQLNRLGLTLLVVFSWIITFITFRFVSLLDIPLAQWLNVSSTTVWVAYIGGTWLATALAVGLIGKHRQQEGEII
jgi:anti-sigma factor RsiW